MTKLLIAAVALFPLVTACKKTADGEYEVDKPTVGMEKDTIHTPEVDASMKEKEVVVPKIEIGKETTTVKVPDIEVKKN